MEAVVGPRRTVLEGLLSVVLKNDLTASRDDRILASSSDIEIIASSVAHLSGRLELAPLRYSQYPFVLGIFWCRERRSTS